MKDIKGKNIWIIGASSGIGKALAKELSDQGATLILSARREEKLQDLNQELSGKHHVVPLDVVEYENVRSVIQNIQGLVPQLDSAIFLAAIYSPHKKEKKDIEEIHKILNVNIGGAYNCAHALQSVFEKQGFGQMVLCGSVAGYRGLPYGQPYCSTKAAIISLAESLRLELASKNIDVKVINPGFVKTPLTDKNDFPMPMIIEAADAAQEIAKGLTRNSFEIHFPKRFTFIMKFLQMIPYWLYFKLMKDVRPDD